MVWFAVLGLLSLVELKSGRVADPEELSSRSRLHVLGVVPRQPFGVGSTYAENHGAGAEANLGST